MTQKTLTVILLIIFIISIGAATCIVLIKLNQPIRKLPSSCITTRSITPTDETANWQTYTNEKYGFSFKYPKGWISVKKDAILDSANWVATFQSSDFNNSDRGIISSGERIKLEVQSPSEWSIFEGGFGLECQIVVKNDKTGKIDGADSWILEAYGDDKCEINPEKIIQSWGRGRILSPRNDQISLDYSGKDKTTLTTYDEILSTLKFTK